MQTYFGSSDDFFDFRFTTDKDPNALAEFYGSEEFMEIFCIFPFVVEFMMKQGQFAADALPGYDQTVNTFGLSGPGGMEVSMAFDEGTQEGRPDVVAYFNKRERFKDWAPFLPKYMGVVFWDLTQNFGYHRKSDGTCEVYHHGETFYGPFPIRIVFTLHAAYVAYATRRYIENPEFGNQDKLEELEHSRQNIPKVVFDEFLQGLTSSVEKAKKEAVEKKQPVAKHEEVLAKLKDAAGKKGLKTYATVYQANEDSPQKVKLQVDNAAVQETIRSALAHIGEAEGQGTKPQAALEELLAASEVLIKDIKAKEAAQSDEPAAMKGPKPLKKMIRRQSSLLAIESIEATAAARAKSAGGK